MAPVADWYFDFISPYAYLQSFRLGELTGRIALRYRPVLFAGLLNHWGQLGPAEIPPKRDFTYAHVAWLARRLGVPLRLPAAHPFNPLRLLRLAELRGNDPALVARLFAWVWCDGHVPEQADAWAALLESLALEEMAEIDSAPIKQRVLDNGTAAIAAGVFGVPSLVVAGRVFWGLDATDMLLDWLDDAAPFEQQDRQIAAIPAAAVRRVRR